MLQLKDIKKITFKGVEYLPGSFRQGFLNSTLILDGYCDFIVIVDKLFLHSDKSESKEFSKKDLKITL
jgi:hypothetical protein